MPEPLPSLGPEEIIAAQRTIVPIVATFAYPDFEPIGTAFIIYTEGKNAIALTAAHNFEAMARLDRPYDIYHPTMPQEFRPVVRSINFRNATPRVLYPGLDGSMFTVRITGAYVLIPADIAVVTLSIPNTLPDDLVFSEKLVIDSSPSRVGTPIRLVWYWNMSANPQQDEIGTGTRFSGRFDPREGEIIKVFRTLGPRNKPWPCFQCNTPIDSGMSGAPLLDISGNHDVFAVGIASSDSSLAPSLAASGADAFASILWPAMTIRLDQENLGGMNAPTLMDLARQGLISDRGRAHEHIQVHPASTSEHSMMRWV
jgi:hypothetical protein